MKTVFFYLALSALLLQTGPIIAQSSDLSAIVDKYHSSLEANNQGIALLVKKDGHLHTASLGTQGLDEHSVFNIGSATKTFTAVLLLQEMERGTLSLSDTIGTYLSPLKNVDPSLTLVQLLTHESGLDEVVGKNILDIFYAKNDSLYTDNLLYQIEGNKPETIGTFNYCNTNYLLLGKILEKVTDQHYFDLLRERIFVPLQMHNTYPYLHKNLPNLARPTHEGKDVAAYMDYRFYAHMAHAAGSIAATLQDMERFYTALFESDILLKRETLALMMESGNERYGLGLFKFTDGETIRYGHGGNNIGYAFRNAYDPETGNLFLMFSNAISIPQNTTLKKDLLAYMENKSIKPFNAVDLNRFQAYAGTYLLKEADLVLEIVLEGSKMYLVAPSQGVKSELVQKDDTSLYDTTVGVTLTLTDDGTDHLLFQQNGYTTTIAKTEPERP